MEELKAQLERAFDAIRQINPSLEERLRLAFQKGGYDGLRREILAIMRELGVSERLSLEWARVSQLAASLPVGLLLVHSRAFSHRKVAEHIAERYSVYGPMRLEVPRHPGFVEVGNLIFVGTMDKYSVGMFSMYDVVSGSSVYYCTTEGLPVLTPKAVEYLRGARVVANSEYTRGMVERAGVRVDGVVPHAVKPAVPDRKKVAELKKLKKRNRVVLWVGANQVRKGLDVLLEAARRVRRKRVLFLVLTGLGEVDLRELEQLKNVVVRYEIGNLSEEELAAYYATSDLVITTSYSEGFGMTVAEAIAYGKKVLAPDYPPFTEFVKRKWLVPVEKRWWELYKGYMWFEMKRPSAEALAEMIPAALDDDDNDCGKYYGVEVYDRFARYLR